MKVLSRKKFNAIKAEVKMMLHASRDCLRNQGVDTTKVRFDCRDGYYGEAFGIFRALAILGYGSITQACNTPPVESNFNRLMHEWEEEVLKEEGYDGNNQCDYCLNRYGKDSVREG
jgi:hypothetical protein